MMAIIDLMSNSWIRYSNVKTHSRIHLFDFDDILVD